MPATKVLQVKESLEELKKIKRTVSAYLKPRIDVLIVCKKNDTYGLSKTEIAKLIGVGHCSVTAWRRKYETGGIEGLLKHNKTGYKPTIFNQDEKNKLAALLSNPDNKIKGYVELKDWVEKNFGKKMKYVTIYKYARRKHGTKIKVARKSHIHKDKEAVNTLKKTFVISAKPLLKKKKQRDLKK